MAPRPLHRALFLLLLSLHPSQLELLPPPDEAMRSIVARPPNWRPAAAPWALHLYTCSSACSCAFHTPVSYAGVPRAGFARVSSI
mmetsp:Transcript_94943/g.284558  ORF Transcript_94943/g.284558 Transcript_94943/m.284558 type:complete len:85 (-) Transcript_94943:371-625(-)